MRGVLRTSPVLLIASIILVVAFAPADAQFGRNKIQYKNYEWQILTSPHFEIHFYKGEEAFAVRAALIMEDGYRMLMSEAAEVIGKRTQPTK